MRFPCLLLVSAIVLATPAAASAQDITDQKITSFLAGVAAEKPELEKVGAELDALDEQIKEFGSCAEIIRETMSGLKAKAALKVKCGRTSVDGLVKERRQLLEKPEKVGAAAAGMDVRAYAKLKESVLMYLRGIDDFPDSELKVFARHASALEEAMGFKRQTAKASNGGGGGIGDRIGNAIAGKVRMFTPDMTWAYVSYLWGLMYMSGATMFESDYKAGEWTQWEIVDASQPDQRLVIERALLSRAPDKSEWWRIKTISSSRESADTIILESQFKPMDAEGLTMQVVRMRGKMPGDTEGKELMVPEHLAMLSMSAFPMKPTAESIAGATVGTESVKVGSSSYSAKKVKFGNAGGAMQWWLADKAPGTVVKVEFSGREADQKWTMQMVGAGSGAKSELGIK